MPAILRLNNPNVENPRTGVTQYVHNGDPSTVQLRAGAAYSHWMSRGEFVIVGPLCIDNAGWRPMRVFMQVPGSIAAAEQVEKWAADPQVRVIVDVPGPLLWPRALAGEAARREWSQPQRQEAARRGIAAADAVTTPHVGWDSWPHHLSDLRNLNPNAHILPDCDGDPSHGRRSAAMLELLWYGEPELPDES